MSPISTKIIWLYSYFLLNILNGDDNDNVDNNNNDGDDNNSNKNSNNNYNNSKKCSSWVIKTSTPAPMIPKH